MRIFFLLLVFLAGCATAPEPAPTPQPEPAPPPPVVVAPKESIAVAGLVETARADALDAAVQTIDAGVERAKSWLERLFGR